MAIYKPYEDIMAITGLSGIKLHQLRTSLAIRSKTTGHPDYTPLICLNDVKEWQQLNNKKLMNYEEIKAKYQGAAIEKAAMRNHLTTQVEAQSAPWMKRKRNLMSLTMADYQPKP